MQNQSYMWRTAGIVVLLWAKNGLRSDPRSSNSENLVTRGHTPSAEGGGGARETTFIPAVSNVFRRHWFCSFLYKVCLRVSETLLLALRTLSLCLSSLITLPKTVRLFYVSLRSQASQQQYTMLSFSLMQRRHGYSHNWPLHVHYGNTLGIPFSDA